MPNFKSVSDFLKAVQEGETYVRNAGHSRYVDLLEWERSLLGLGEMNLLRDFGFHDKFVSKSFDSGFEVASYSLAKPQDELPWEEGSLSSSKTYAEDFLMDPVLMLNARQAVVYVSTDLRHMFLKGYLMAQSFNLAVTSGRTKYKFNALAAKMYRNPKPSTKLAKLMKNSLVVDVAHFTREQVWLIVEMCNEYPAKRFGPANIYNNLSLAADDLVLFCDDWFQQGEDPGYGSPELMWNDIVNIALKFEALDDLGHVVSSFRGVPGILRSVNRWSGEDSFPLEYPLSFSISLGVKSTYSITPAVTGYADYFATSKCLVADLLLSQMMVLSFFNVIEDIGGLGSLCVPTGNAKTDALFNSVLRNHGLSSEVDGDNCIYEEWKAIRKCDIVRILSA
ncbi:unnamed protein product [Cuscuta campestris]|uniref:Uncharacterized protein n=1 Tax=Cuscuta campestris TaxID=132261 RepID=A0A484L7C8_9ASTE|nr:unnamed protein product [Cuscuta campestris]